MRAGWVTSPFDGEGAKGPIAKNLEAERVAAIKAACGLEAGDAVFFAAGKADEAPKFAGAVRTRVGGELGLVEENAFRFCWIVDFSDVRAERGNEADRFQP